MRVDAIAYRAPMRAAVQFSFLTIFYCEFLCNREMPQHSNNVILELIKDN